MTNIQEIWKPIKNYEGLYEVSNLGRVKRLAETRELFGGRAKMFFNDKILTPKKHNGGYQMVCLSKSGTNNYKTIHRLVAMEFIENTEGKPEVNHKNANKKDNRSENLEWCTASENQRHAFKLGIKNLNPVKGSKHYSAKSVFFYDDNCCIINHFASVLLAAEWCGIKYATLMLHLHKSTLVERNGYFISFTNFYL